MYDVIIIGAGPAGLSASIYAKRAGLRAITIDQNPISGGQVLNTYEVDNYPGLPGINGFDLGMKFREHADKLGCDFVTATVSHIVNLQGEAGLQAASVDGVDDNEIGFRVVTDAGIFTGRTVLVATGASHAKLNVPGEEELSGMGVSYCATCDGAFFKDKVVAVIGGGDVAVEDAIFLARGCNKVYLIHRRDQLRAAGILQDKVKNLPNVEILWDTVVERIEGVEQVESLLIKNVKTDETNTIPLDGVFVAVGIIPDSQLLQELAACDEKGYVLAGEDGSSSMPGLFVAGDIRVKKLRQIITAAADGANAITAIQEYLLQKN